MHVFDNVIHLKYSWNGIIVINRQILPAIIRLYNITFVQYRNISSTSIMPQIFRKIFVQSSSFLRNKTVAKTPITLIFRSSAINTSNPIVGEIGKQADGIEKTECVGEIRDMFAPSNVSFGNMTSYQMIRSLLILNICSFPGLADNAPKVLKVVRQCLGKTMFSKLMRMTFYGQFVSGDKHEEIKKTAEKLKQCNVLSMLAVSIEDENEDSDLCGEELYDYNMSKVLRCIDISHNTRILDKPCMMQIKLTALLNFNLLESISNILKKSSDPDVTTTQLSLWMVNDSTESELSKIVTSLTGQDVDVFASGLRRLKEISTQAEHYDVTILIDAEYTWVNPAIHCICIALMKTYNKTCARIYTTYQGYLKETRDLIHRHAKQCCESNTYFGFKLVRGAYLIPETIKVGMHPSYMCESVEATNKNYNSCVQDIFAMDRERVQVMFATHNEDSVRLAVDLLSKRNKRHRNASTASNIRFAQLYGMADYMSFTLSKMGYEVYKSLPYGSVEETMPYLCRRAKENTLFLTGVRKEMIMLKKGLTMKYR